MTHYIKAREVENLKCYVDELIEKAKTHADMDVFYRGKLSAYEDFSRLLDGVLETASDEMLKDIRYYVEQYEANYWENEQELKETRGISPFLSGKNSIYNEVIEHLNEFLGEYDDAN